MFGLFTRKRKPKPIPEEEEAAHQRRLQHQAEGYYGATAPAECAELKLGERLDRFTCRVVAVRTVRSALYKPPDVRAVEL